MNPRGTVVASLIRVDSGAATSTAMRPDGTISFSGVAPGKYRPVVRGTHGYFASEVRVVGVELRDETGRIQGFVMRGEKGAEGMLVVLAPVSENASAPAAPGFQTDSDGSFDYQSVPAGDYLLFAVDESGLEYSTREVVVWGEIPAHLCRHLFRP